MEITVSGVDELERFFRGLDVSVRVPILERAARTGAEIVREAVVARTPVGRTGNLRRSISVRVRREGEAVSARVRPAPGRGAHGHLVEYGHRLLRQGPVWRDHRTGQFRSRKGQTRGRGGRFIGVVPPHPFFGPAVEASKDRAANQMMAVMAQALAEQVARA